jgi:nucleoside-diphosphate-sugar epimerase
LRNHVHAGDAAEGLARALLLGRPGQVYNVGSRDHLTNVDFARRIAAAAPYPVEVALARPDAPADHMVISIEKAARELGFAPSFRIDEHLPLAVRVELEQLEKLEHHP